MAKRTFANANFDQFAKAIHRMAMKVNEIDEFGNLEHEGNLAQMARIAGQGYLGIAKEESPVDTGMLRNEHLISDVELSNTGGLRQARISIYINPDPTLVNVKRGGFPGQYGPAYHDRYLQWFRIAAVATEPLFKRIIQDEVKFFFQGFW